MHLFPNVNTYFHESPEYTMSSLLTHASLMKLSKSDLQDKCDASNVRRSGNKDALVE
jgi:hypothetical protein